MVCLRQVLSGFHEVPPQGSLHTYPCVARPATAQSRVRCAAVVSTGQACIKKQAAIAIPCPYCDCDFLKPELDTHIRKCPTRKARGIKLPKGFGCVAKCPDLRLAVAV